MVEMFDLFNLMGYVRLNPYNLIPMFRYIMNPIYEYIQIIVPKFYPSHQFGLFPVLPLLTIYM
jgi:hypothetical protein